jgi:hypothetical protein
MDAEGYPWYGIVQGTDLIQGDLLEGCPIDRTARLRRELRLCSQAPPQSGSGKLPFRFSPACDEPRGLPYNGDDRSGPGRLAPREPCEWRNRVS